MHRCAGPQLLVGVGRERARHLPHLRPLRRRHGRGCGAVDVADRLSWRADGAARGAERNLAREPGGTAAASPGEIFAGWFVVIAAPITATFLAVRMSAGAPRWVALLLIAPTVPFATALVGLSIAVVSGPLRL